MVSVPVLSDIELTDLAARVGAEALRRYVFLATAESCSGGWVAKVLTDVPGSSSWFKAGVVTYDNETKQKWLGVRSLTLERHGAVSEETVREMVSGVLAMTRAGVAVAVTGIAGPAGGTLEKPVGGVWIGWQRRDGYVQAGHYHFTGDRKTIRRQTVAVALNGLRKILTC